MIEMINILLPLAIQVIILYGLSQLIDRLVLRNLGRGWYLALTWPGVMVHELSHLAGCLITFTRVTRIELFHPHGNTLGMVEHVQTRNPIKNIIISIAPLFGVTAVLWLLTRWVFPDLYIEQVNAVRVGLSDFTSFSNFFSFSGEYVRTLFTYIGQLFQAMDFGQWQTYVFLYLMITLSSHAAPSKVDLKHTYVGLAGLAALFVLLGFVARWLDIGGVWTVFQWVSYPVIFLTNFLMYGIVFSIIALIPFAGLSVLGKVLKKGRI